MPKVKGPKKRKGRQMGAPEETNRFRAAYKKSVKLMQEAIGAATGEAKFPGIQTGNGPINKEPPPPPERARLAAQGSAKLDTTDVLQDIAWQPQPGPQTAMLVCPVEDIFFGGARGGEGAPTNDQGGERKRDGRDGNPNGGFRNFRSHYRWYDESHRCLSAGSTGYL